MNDSLTSVLTGKVWPAIATWERKVDTIDLKYNIHCKHYRKKFNKIIILENVLKSGGPYSFIYEESDTPEIARLSSFFSEIDSNRLKEINKMFTKWSEECIEERFVSKKELNKLFDKDREKGWKKYRKKYGAPYLSFSIPVFSSSFDIAYFEWSYVCGGLCGAGYSGFYRRVDEKWTLILIRNDWVS
jgi:hypothetical protein